MLFVVCNYHYLYELYTLIYCENFMFVVKCEKYTYLYFFGILLYIPLLQFTKYAGKILTQIKKIYVMLLLIPYQ